MVDRHETKTWALASLPSAQVVGLSLEVPRVEVCCFQPATETFRCSLCRTCTRITLITRISCIVNTTLSIGEIQRGYA